MDKIKLQLAEQWVHDHQAELQDSFKTGHLAHVLAAGGYPYAYSAGLTGRLGFELVVFGAAPRAAVELIAVVARHLMSKHVNDGEEIREVAARPLKLATQSIRDRSGARSLAPAFPLIFGSGFTPMQVRQICWPDAGGRYPGDAGFDMSYPLATQVLLGEMTARLN